jgi:hypothetical protein
VDQGIHDVMSVTGHERSDKTGLGWRSPRWRNPDAPAQRVIERERRFRNTPAPCQQGAIDDYRTIARDEGSGLPGHLETPLYAR